MNEEETRALARDELRKAFITMRLYASLYGGEDNEVTDEIASMIKDVADDVVSELTPEPCHHAYAINAKGHSLCQLCGSPRPQASEPEPANPFAPKHTAQEWAEKIRSVIRLAKDDGCDLWFDTVDYFGPGPCLRVSPRDRSPDWENDPIAWELNNA